MRAIMVMFDSLARRHLPPFADSDAVIAPNFARLADRAVTFGNCYAGSMPCMPARRELHTGRYNFLHRSWGPMEPFDDSVPQILRRNGVATHLATDHMHYWEDGGATYHTRYGTFTLVRGQQGDPWKGRVRDPEVGDHLRLQRSGTWRQDQINRQYLTGLADHPQTLTFDAGLEFIEDNAHEQQWFVQIETFDPHEPFYSDPSFEALYPGDDDGPDLDWPDYVQVIDDDALRARVRRHYDALVTMCDASLGRVLDAMDEHRLWDDTMLIVCTDHGFLLGEHGWWGKSVPPWFDETIHTPLYVWDPRSKASGEYRAELVQTIDLGPTLLDFFGLGLTPDMQGRPLAGVLTGGAPIREFGLFGGFGGHVSITDGRYVYMRAPADERNEPLFEHTLMPTHMRGMFTGTELRAAELVPPFGFTKGMPLLRTPASGGTNPYAFGTRLYDLQTDPRQEEPLCDDAIETRMAQALVAALRAGEAPESQFQRLGLPSQGPVGPEHLLCRAQQRLVSASSEPPPTLAEFPVSRLDVRTPVSEIVADPAGAAVLSKYSRSTAAIAPFGDIWDEAPLYRAAPMLFGALPWQTLRAVADELAALDGRVGRD